MTIERGSAFGRAGELSPDGITVRSDSQARQTIESAWLLDDPLPDLGLLGGDLCRTLGGSGVEDRLRTSSAMRFPIDLGVIEFGRERHCFIAHAVMRRRGWLGRGVVAMNAQWLGEWDLGPRSHPNDGLLDVTDGAVPFGERRQARQRAKTGSHLPHPGLHSSRVTSIDLRFDRPLGIWLDGVKVGRSTDVHLEIQPDAFIVVI